MYAVIDVETTGGSFVNERLTEIAIYLHDGNRIVDEFSTLINPEQPIPAMITRLTGISNEMVADAPKFYEVARKIVEITEGAVFVAHNASFDYNFIRHEFKRLGYTFKRQTLCTVKLSRKVLPGLPSYSLGKLCNQLGIVIENRHRAAGDALATTHLLELLLKTDAETVSTQAGERIPDSIRQVPEDTGVYYLHDENGRILYIGKSNNMFERLVQHMRNSDTTKAIEMRSRVASVSYELTGNELIALLLESAEIKKFKPPFNRAQRRSVFSYGLFVFTDENGYRQLYTGRNLNGHQPVTSFTTHEHARRYLYRLVERYELCQKLCGLYHSDGACFHHSIRQCKGACIGHESPLEYNLRVQKAISNTGFDTTDFYIVLNGRNHNEVAVVKIAGGRYAGFGYTEAQITDPSQFDACISAYDDNRDVRQIIRNYLKKNPKTRIINSGNSHEQIFII